MMGYGSEFPVFSDSPHFDFDKDGKIIKDDRAVSWAITLSSEEGKVSPLAPDFGPCQLWTRQIEPSKENRGYAMMRDPLDGRMRYVYRILHRVHGGGDKAKWYVHPLCHNRKCVNPSHWAK